ncbi:MAG: hypothetical protein JXR51_06165 [Bacteroidales bacterium]|nr:hypothetical protein [Bacteroidales bacterium]MBN2756746.1 hypothetical protein [Bacteroidales bacterium]
MNILKGEIFAIENFEGISLVDIKIDDDHFSSLIIETEATKIYIKIGNEIYMLFKETEISLKNFHDKIIKRKNKFVAEVVAISKGRILSDIELNYKNILLNTIVLTRHLNELNLKIGDKAVMILRTQEILLSKSET